MGGKWLNAKQKNNKRDNIDSYTHTATIVKIPMDLGINGIEKLEELNKREFTSQTDFYNFIYEKVGLTPVAPIKADTTKEPTRIEQLKQTAWKYTQKGTTDEEIKAIMKGAKISQAEIDLVFKKDDLF